MLTNKGQTILSKYLIGQTNSYASHIAIGCGQRPYSTTDDITYANIAEQRAAKSLEFEMLRLPIKSRGFLTDVNATSPINMITVNGSSITYEYISGGTPQSLPFEVGDRVNVTGVADTRFNVVDAIIVSKSSTSFTIKKNTGYSGPQLPLPGTVTSYYTSIVLSADLPTEERYEITEIGLYPAVSNPDAGSQDSKNIFAFSQSENWVYESTTGSESIPVVYSKLDASNEAGNIDGTYNGKDCYVLHTNSDNHIFSNIARINRHETCRFLNNIIAVRGNTSTITYNTGTKVLTKNASSPHIKLNGLSLGFDKNSPSDELRLAFSVLSRLGTSSTPPARVLISMDFVTSDGYIGTLDYVAENSVDDPMLNFQSNRYIVLKKSLSDLKKNDSRFAWNKVSSVSVYVNVINQAGEKTEDFYVALDALRLENVSSDSAIYGLTGYAVVKTVNGVTIKKLANTTNSIEFRFGFDT
jgi:hypothetical protein